MGRRIEWEDFGAAVSAAELEPILALVAAARGLDFRDYRPEVPARGVGLRIAATSSRDAEAYRRRLDEDPLEIDRLLHVLVVPVSGFFRDRPVFDALARRVLPEISRLPGPVRAWAIGAATGEEAWSLAMLLALECERIDVRGFEVIGTDIDERSLDVARGGTYSEEVARELAPDLRARFLMPRAGAWTIAGPLRAHVRFARHDLLGARLAPRDAIVPSFRLILFRNVLIYFERRLQRKALERVLSTLEPDGVLVLGPVETLPEGLAGRLEPFPAVDARLRVFRARGEGG